MTADRRRHEGGPTSPRGRTDGGPTSLRLRTDGGSTSLRLRGEGGSTSLRVRADVGHKSVRSVSIPLSVTIKCGTETDIFRILRVPELAETRSAFFFYKQVNGPYRGNYAQYRL